MTKLNFVLAGMMLAAVMLPPALPAQAADVAPPESVAPKNLLSLEEAINLALENSPMLQAQMSRQKVTKANVDQASALPNPELSVEAENIMGDGAYSGFDSAEMTYGVAQLIELPGKRSSRINVANNEVIRGSYEAEAAKLDLIQNVTIAFAEAVTAKETAKVLLDENELAQSVYESVAAKVEAGKEPPIQQKKAQVSLSNTRIAADRAERSANAKIQALRALMGGSAAPSLQMESLPKLSAPQPFDVYKTKLEQTPDYLVHQADISRAEAELALEKANAVPDPTFNIGVRDFRDDNSQALVAGVSLPIPIFNRNKAAIVKSGHTLNAVRLEQRGALLQKEVVLAEAYDDLTAAYHAAEVLQREVLPGAEEAFDIAQESYKAGKLGYLDVLDARRTLFDARREEQIAQLEYYRAKAVIERLTAAASQNIHQKEH